ncbi:hypothetical protein Pelo_14168 [Pelomyxa schiedti]|nr:hypothetical protein Pelo_14168 [Pelomyxa schiedti]
MQVARSTPEDSDSKPLIQPWSPFGIFMRQNIASLRTLSFLQQCDVTRSLSQFLREGHTTDFNSSGCHESETSLIRQYISAFPSLLGFWSYTEIRHLISNVKLMGGSTPSVHWLKFLNELYHHSDKAEYHLHRYYDAHYRLTPQMPATLPTSNVTSPCALLSLAQLHDEFRQSTLSSVALREAREVAQERGLHTDPHIQAWMHSLEQKGDTSQLSSLHPLYQPPQDSIKSIPEITSTGQRRETELPKKPFSDANTQYLCQGTEFNEAQNEQLSAALSNTIFWSNNGNPSMSAAWKKVSDTLCPTKVSVETPVSSSCITHNLGKQSILELETGHVTTSVNTLCTASTIMSHSESPCGKYFRCVLYWVLASISARRKMLPSVRQLLLRGFAGIAEGLPSHTTANCSSQSQLTSWLQGLFDALHGNYVQAHRCLTRSCSKYAGQPPPPDSVSLHDVECLTRVAYLYNVSGNPLRGMWSSLSTYLWCKSHKQSQMTAESALLLCHAMLYGLRSPQTALNFLDKIDRYIPEDRGEAPAKLKAQSQSLRARCLIALAPGGHPSSAPILSEAARLLSQAGIQFEAALLIEDAAECMHALSLTAHALHWAAIRNSAARAWKSLTTMALQAQSTAPSSLDTPWACHSLHDALEHFLATNPQTHFCSL